MVLYRLSFIVNSSIDEASTLVKDAVKTALKSVGGFRVESYGDDTGSVVLIASISIMDAEVPQFVAELSRSEDGVALTVFAPIDWVKPVLSICRKVKCSYLNVNPCGCGG